MMPETILYLAGYSRSGSTILDMMLGRNPAVVSTGELTYLLDDADNPNRVCTCGARYGECLRFGPWLNSQAGKAAMAAKTRLRAIESRGGLEVLKSGSVSAEDADLYRNYATALYSHLTANTGARIIVDSSKSTRDVAGRPLALARLAGLPTKVLHLTRDPRAVIKSYAKDGSNWVAEKHRKPKPLESFRPVIGWTKANKIARGFADDFKSNYLHVRYEDLMTDPVTILGKIGAFAGVSLDAELAAAQAGEPFLADHNVGGNRTRLEPQTIRLAKQQPTKLPVPHELACRAMMVGVARMLGYN